MSSIFEDQLNFSEQYPLSYLSVQETTFLNQLNNLKHELNFPAIKNDIGSFFNFLVKAHQVKTIFEFGSGYGHSAFWYFVDSYLPTKIYLTEKRSDLIEHFENLPWSEQHKKVIDYHQGDAFEKLEELSQNNIKIDFLLIDGQKSSYKDFLISSFNLLSDQAILVIDNAFWKGSVIKDELVSKSSQKSIRELDQYLRSTEVSNQFVVQYFPFRDGLVLLKRK